MRRLQSGHRNWRKIVIVTVLKQEETKGWKLNEVFPLELKSKSIQMTNWMDFLTNLWVPHHCKYSDKRWTQIWGNPTIGRNCTRWTVKPLLMLRFHCSKNHTVRALKTGRGKRDTESPSYPPNFSLLAGSLERQLLFITEMLNLTGMPNLIYNLLAYFPSFFLYYYRHHLKIINNCVH